MDPTKKISFSFSKQSKKPTFLRQPSPPKVELVECLEGQSVKVKDAVEDVHEPLVIPIKEDRKGIVDRIKQARAKQSNEANATNQELDDKPDSELTLDELAAKELLNDAKKRLEQQNEPEGKVLLLPTKEKVALEGEPEPTIEDYENIPISDYGLAMLRGMGWKEGMGIGKKAVKINLTKPPDIRPKGLGLGATRVIQEEKSKEKAVDKDGKQLILVKGAFCKIIAGSNKGSYCKVLGLDEEASRVIVKTALKETILSLNEFMLVPVSEEEYTRNSKILNHAKYEEYQERINNDLVKKGPDSVSDDLGNPTSSNQTKESTSRSHSSYGENSIKQERTETPNNREYSQDKSKHNIDKHISKNHSPRSDKELRRDDGNHRRVKQEKYIKEKYYSKDKSSSREKKSRSRSRRDSSVSSSNSEGPSESHKSKPKKKETGLGSNDDKKTVRSKKSKNSGEKCRNDSSSDSESVKKVKHHKKKDKRSRKDRSRSPRRKHSNKNSHRRRPSSSDSEYEHHRSKSKK